MRATGSPASRRRAKSSRRSDSSAVSGRLAASDHAGEIEPERRAEQHPRVEFGRIDSPDLNCAVSTRRAVSTVGLVMRSHRSPDGAKRNPGRIHPSVQPRIALRSIRATLAMLHAAAPWAASWAAWCSVVSASISSPKRFTRHHLRQLVERQVDAVVGDAALREIIGADALAPVAGADLLAAVGRARGIDALALGVVDARAQDVHRRSAVLVLRPLVLHHHHDAGRNMGDADRRIRSC